MKNNQKGFIVPILLAIIALLVIGGGAYIYQNKKAEAPAPVDNTETQQTNQIQQQTDTQTPSVNTQMNNVNWETYTDNVYGFELKYPSSWFQSIHGASLVLASTNVLGGDPPTISIGSLDGFGKSSLEDIYNGNNERKIDFKKDCTAISFASVSAYRCLTDSEALYPKKPIIFLLKNSISFEIRDNIDDEISHQILSTFKFTK